MRRIRIAILLAGTSVCLLNAQQVPPDPALQHQPSGRASYDPMARAKGTVQPKGIIETTLAGVNPRNTDYGQVVAEWRKEVFENTLHEVYFWGLLGTTMLLGLSVMGNGCFLRERERRLTITADVVTQLYNAYVAARSRAFQVIDKHNQLVGKFQQRYQNSHRIRNCIEVRSRPTEPRLGTLYRLFPATDVGRPRGFS